MLDKQRLRSFVLGGVAGLLAGILLAPRSGRELRGSIRDRAGEARERSRESLFEAQERMQERISEVREGPDGHLLEAQHVRPAGAREADHLLEERLARRVLGVAVEDVPAPDEHVKAPP